jgi:hypothetical protein
MKENAKDILKFFTALAAVALLILGLLYLTGERHTKLAVAGGNPPKFAMSGSGTLRVLRIAGQKKQREMIGSDSLTCWMIKPESGYAHGEAIELRSPITYGKIPPEYMQIYPQQGAALPLVEGEEYTVFAETMNANHGIRRFFIQNRKAVEMSE